MKNQFITYFLVVLSFSACSKDDSQDNTNGLSSTAEKFLNEVLDIMENNSINRLEINWSDVRNEVFEESKGAQIIADTYPGIRKALELLEDNHSIFLKSTGGAIFVGTLNCDSPSISTPVLPNDIGYVKINSFSGSSNSDEGVAFANDIQDQIRNQDSSTINGWVIDLRGNLGGNMWPMLTGVGPILGEGIAGYFIGPTGNQTYWSYLNGTSTINGQSILQLTDHYSLKVSSPKVAVLLDNGVASSGEVIAVSFVGRENTKSFGSSTCGLSTSNTQFRLSNNSTLFLTTAYLANRNKRLYGVPVQPDQSSNSENIVQDAVNWIQN